MNKKILIIIILVIILGSIIFIYFTNKKNNLLELTFNEVKEKIDNKESYILCLSRTTCSHCQDYLPRLKRIANKYNVKIYYTEIDKYDDNTYNEFQKTISFDGATPTTIFFKNGEEKTTATRIEGDVSEDKILEKIKQNGFLK